MKSFWPYIASAAIIIGILAGVYLVVQSPSPVKLADRYIKQNFQTLGVTMSGVQDSVQTALRFYNEGKLIQALEHFEAIIRSNPADFTSIKYAGIVLLQLEQYDKAIFYFNKLEQNPGLYANPGKFYHALALMKRNKPGDQTVANDLLQKVVELNLEGKETAQRWIRQFQ